MGLDLRVVSLLGDFSVTLTSTYVLHMHFGVINKKTVRNSAIRTKIQLSFVFILQ